MAGGALRRRRVSRLQNQKTLPGQRVVFVGDEAALKSLGQARLSHRPLHEGLQCGKGIEHRGGEHIARHPADGVESNVGQDREAGRALQRDGLDHFPRPVGPDSQQSQRAQLAKLDRVVAHPGRDSQAAFPERLQKMR